VSDQEKIERVMVEFHRHLDLCTQCREHPFGLCKEGEVFARMFSVRDSKKTKGGVK